MKVMSLNAWGGHLREPLLEFIKRNSDTDIFCFQEMFSKAHVLKDEHPGKALDLFDDIKGVIPTHKGFFRPAVDSIYGLAVFLRVSLSVDEEGDVFVYQSRGYSPKKDGNKHISSHARNIQYIKTNFNNEPLTVINFHGLWDGESKTDTEDRLKQSRKILDFTKTLSGDFILCGDFNLLPDTESLKAFESAGLRNLIKEFGVTSTRTSHYKKEEKFADYIFVSDGINVKNFEVLPDEVSDHAPLLLEIE